MTHSICTGGADGGLRYFQRLWRTLLAPNIRPRTKLEQLFEHETAEFGLEYAFLARIDLEDETEHFEIVHGSHEKLRPGATVPLSETYCRKTIADPEGTVAVSDALAEGWEGDPAYEAFELGSYLGTTISNEDELYGTLCFANPTAREESIKDEEKALLEMHAQWVEYTLALSDGSAFRETRTDTIEGRSVSSDAIDSMMDALRSPTRRGILMTLVGDTTEVDLGSLDRQLHHDYDRARIHHGHLPKLDDYGYVEWERDAEIISKGARFADVEPLVRLLKEYETARNE